MAKRWWSWIGLLHWAYSPLPRTTWPTSRTMGKMTMTMSKSAQRMRVNNSVTGCRRRTAAQPLLPVRIGALSSLRVYRAPQSAPATRWDLWTTSIWKNTCGTSRSRASPTSSSLWGRSFSVWAPAALPEAVCQLKSQIYINKGNNAAWPWLPYILKHKEM